MLKSSIITALIFFLSKKTVYVIYKIATRTPNKGYNDFTLDELESGYGFMYNEIQKNVVEGEMKQRLFQLLQRSWYEFKVGKFKVDGATFIGEQYGNFFNLWWFNHDRRNHFGFVGEEIDDEMFAIMTLLNVPTKHLRDAFKWIPFTWINEARHRFILKDLKNELPNDIILLK